LNTAFHFPKAVAVFDGLPPRHGAALWAFTLITIGRHPVCFING